MIEINLTTCRNYVKRATPFGCSKNYRALPLPYPTMLKAPTSQPEFG